MDTITQGIFGGVVAQAGFGHKFGKRAAIYGSVAGIVPDLDVFYPSAHPFAEWIYHRAITHSVIAAPFFGMAAGYFIWRFLRWRGLTDEDPALDNLPAWMGLGVLCAVSHIWLDLLTPYGTQLLAPLSETRFSLNAMPIIDFVYTAVLLAALLFALIGKAPQAARSAVAGAALLISVAWQLYGWQINMDTERKARAEIRLQTDAPAAVHSYPTLFQPWGRRVTAETASAIYLGTYSPLAGGDIFWRAYGKETHPLIAKMRETLGFRVLDWFADGEVFWRVRQMEDGGVEIEAHDLRYMASADRLHGLWGVRGRFDAEGRLIGEVERFQDLARRLSSLSEIFSDVARLTFQGAMPQGAQGAMARERLSDPARSPRTPPAPQE